MTSLRSEIQRIDGREDNRDDLAVFANHGYELIAKFHLNVNDEDVLMFRLFDRRNDRLTRAYRYRVTNCRHMEQMLNWRWLRHPNIVHLIEYFVDAGPGRHYLYCVCDYLTDEAVGRLMECRKKEFIIENEHHFRRWTFQCLSALAHAHQLHLFYNNFNWSNVCLDENYNAKIADFRLLRYSPPSAKIYQPFSSHRQFNSPEALEGGRQSVDDLNKSELWSIAASLLKVLLDLNVSGVDLDVEPPLNLTDRQLHRHIVNNRHELSSRLKGNFSLTVECRSFLATILCSADIEDRPTVEQALEHSWFHGAWTIATVDELIEKYGHHHQLKTTSEISPGLRRSSPRLVVKPVRKQESEDDDKFEYHHYYEADEDDNEREIELVKPYPLIADRSVSSLYKIKDRLTVSTQTDLKFMTDDTYNRLPIFEAIKKEQENEDENKFAETSTQTYLSSSSSCDDNIRISKNIGRLMSLTVLLCLQNPSTMPPEVEKGQTCDDNIDKQSYDQEERDKRHEVVSNAYELSFSSILMCTDRKVKESPSPWKFVPEFNDDVIQQDNQSTKPCWKLCKQSTKAIAKRDGHKSMPFNHKNCMEVTSIISGLFNDNIRKELNNVDFLMDLENSFQFPEVDALVTGSSVLYAGRTHTHVQVFGGVDVHEMEPLEIISSLQQQRVTNGVFNQPSVMSASESHSIHNERN